MAAPHVAVINLSIGIRDRPFELSPESSRTPAGLVGMALSGSLRSEHRQPPRSRSTVARDAPGTGSVHCSTVSKSKVIRSVAASAHGIDASSRPGEAVNAYSPWHRFIDDASTGAPPPDWSDPYRCRRVFPAQLTPRAWGIAVESNLTCWQPGGRVVVTGSPQRWRPDRRNHSRTSTTKRVAPGQLVASPGVGSEVIKDAVRHSRGTSNATALISRACGLLYDVTWTNCARSREAEVIDSLPRAVWLKALVAHGAEWGSKQAGHWLNILKDQEQQPAVQGIPYTRLLGYGAVDVNRVRECTGSTGYFPQRRDAQTG